MNPGALCWKPPARSGAPYSRSGCSDRIGSPRVVMSAIVSLFRASIADRARGATSSQERSGCTAPHLSPRERSAAGRVRACATATALPAHPLAQLSESAKRICPAFAPVAGRLGSSCMTVARSSNVFGADLQTPPCRFAFGAGFRPRRSQDWSVEGAGQTKIEPRTSRNAARPSREPGECRGASHAESRSRGEEEQRPEELELPPRLRVSA